MEIIGYTNYARTPAKLDAEKFKTLSKELQTVSGLLLKPESSHQMKEVIILAGGDGTGRPKFTEDLILFNGDATTGMDHETFAIEREQKNARIGEKCLVFSFCKTNRKPFDLMVKISLLRLKHHFPECEISCDGGKEDWTESKALYKKAFGGKTIKINE